MIADASVMPRIVSGNTHAPVVMIAERAAEFLLSGVDRSQDRAGYLSDIGPGSTGDQAATE
jgi:choline dehydrogenase-like flavoprotein